MKTDLELLARTFGTVEALFELPFLRVLGEHGLTSQSAWTYAYHRRGLPLGGDRQTVAGLRELTQSGFLSTAGETMGRTWRLTTSGVLTAMAACDLPTENVRDLLARIIELESESDVPNPYDRDGVHLVMAWHVIPDAEFWLRSATQTAGAWKEYQSDLASLCNWLIPLEILGFVTVYHDGRGQIWGVRATEAGRAAVGAWPEHPTGFDGWQTGHPECDACFDAWSAGFDHGIARYAGTPAPKEFQNVVPARLPASAWWNFRASR